MAWPQGAAQAGGMGQARCDRQAALFRSAIYSNGSWWIFCLLQSVDEVNASGIPYFLVGHVGDGNFHFGYLIDPDDASERERAEQLNRQLVARAIGMGGTCSGEHGVGLHKMDFLEQEAGEGALDVMRAIKQALDPLNIMNPGKIFRLQG